MSKDKEALLREHMARYDAAAAGIIEELRLAGFQVGSIGELYNKKHDYQSVIHILIKWLPRISNDAVKEGIIRALSVKWAKGTAAVPLLVAEYERVEDDNLRWVVGNALEVLASDEIADEMIRFSTNKQYGTARQMVVLGLGKLKDPRVVDVLMSLLDDDDVAGHAVDSLGKLRAIQARPRIEMFLHHQKPWIRKEARRALARIDKANGA